MDPVSAAIVLLAPYLAKAGASFASKAGEAAFEATRSLLDRIRRKFDDDGDNYARTTLARLEEKPDDEGRQGALKSVLEEKAQADPAFAGDLERLVQSTVGNQAVSSFVTQVYGGEVGKIVNIANAGVVEIN
jgi:hypothetical protein